MDKLAINGSPKRSWIGYVATVAAALFGGLAVAMPAHSADFYGPGYGEPYGRPWGPAPYYEGAGYQPHCSPCGCIRCGCVPHCFPVVHRRNVIERRWVHREYIERVFNVGGPYGYGGSRYGGSGYGGSGYGGSGYGGVRPYLGYGGINYSPYPMSYGFDAPRAPVDIPGPYYNAAYFE